MADLLPEANYPQIRAAIDLTLVAAQLPDSAIALPIFRDAAIADVLLIDGDADDRTGDDLAAAQRAAVYFCAARLVSALPQITRKAALGSEVAYQAQNAAQRAAELRGLASAALDSYLVTDAATGDRPTFFAAGHGYRGRP